MGKSKKAASKVSRRSPAPAKGERALSEDELEGVAGGKSTQITNATASGTSPNPHLVKSQPKVIITMG